MKIGPRWSTCVSIDEKLPFVIELGPSSMASQHINAEDGYALLLFPYRNGYVELTVPALLALKLGVVKNYELAKIDAVRMAAGQFNAQLSVSP
jgi:hypothetical protein